MSLYTDIKVICDSCANWKIVTSGVRPTRPVAHARAKAAGWVRQGSHCHYCPTCAAELKRLKTQIPEVTR